MTIYEQKLALDRANANTATPSAWDRHGWRSKPMTMTYHVYATDPDKTARIFRRALEAQIRCQAVCSERLGRRGMTREA